MSRRQAIAVLALIGALDSTYLLLEKLGFIGALACGITHGCDTVNTSVFSTFLGMPVAGIGLLGYLAVLIIALVGVQPRWADEARPDVMLAVISGLGLLFSLYLTYAEVFIVRALCQWCLLSQVAILTIFVLASFGVASGRAARAA